MLWMDRKNSNSSEKDIISLELHLSRYKSAFPRFGYRHGQSAVTTPSAPYSSTDLIASYNNDVSKLSNGDDLRINNHHSDQELTRGRRSQSERGAKDPDRIPSSRGRDSKRIPNGRDRDRITVEKDRDREKDHQDRSRESDHALSFKESQKQNYFRPTGMRNNFIGGQQQLPSSQRNTIIQPNPETAIPEGIMAMGTNWQPTSNTNNSRSGCRSGSLGSSSGSLNQSNGSRKNNRSTGSVASSLKCSGEPRYSDPCVGAPPTFQQRIAELNSLESETVRFERSRRVRKKKDP